MYRLPLELIISVKLAHRRVNPGQVASFMPVIPYGTVKVVVLLVHAACSITHHDFAYDSLSRLMLILIEIRICGVVSPQYENFPIEPVEIYTK